MKKGVIINSLILIINYELIIERRKKKEKILLFTCFTRRYSQHDQVKSLFNTWVFKMLCIDAVSNFWNLLIGIPFFVALI